MDKTGAGDCLNGIFLNLIVNGTDAETALRTAVDMATESIKRKGIFGLRPLEDKQTEQEVRINE